MFLKRLEIVGFKSFADRIGIDFVPGVTAVVGPNGSGKSNVTDAIRWVLGEQSAKSLRGSKMEDVIFAGSDSRRPLNFAEVTLVLDNSDSRIPIDFSEISVTRRVFRSGDSEYLLNKQSCRLKDITDLFMDSGLGKEAFSIISQGRVDEILNSRAEDRRTIFEEAAGVLKYKQRKKKAEHKLFETDDNLNRVLDILRELDDRLEPLKMQASAASDFLSMSSELKEIEIALLGQDGQRLSQELLLVLEEMKIHRNNENEFATKISSKEEELSEIRKLLTTIDQTIEQAQGALIEVSSEVERWEGRKLLLAEKRQNADEKLQSLSTNKKEEELKLTQYSNRIEGDRKLLEERQTQLTSIRKEMRDIEDLLKRSASEIEMEIEEQKSIYIERLNEEATVRNELKHIEQQMVQQHEASKRMSSRSTEVYEELQRIRVKRTEKEQELADIQEHLHNKLEEFQVNQKQLEGKKASLDEKQEMLYKAYQLQHQLKGRKDTLEELEADFSGFYTGVKEVLLAREKGELHGIDGAVAELVKVEGEYAKALETALGASLQHIITDTDDSARTAINWLKAKRVGRATFLPRTTMKSRKIHSSSLLAIQSHPSFINTADELVTAEPKYREIVENLLGNVLVAKELKGATQIAKTCGYRYRVVTMDGDVVNAGGSLTGGAVKQQSSLFSRKAELEQLTVKLTSLEGTILSAESAVSELKASVSELTTKITSLRTEGEHLRKSEMDITSELRELASEEKSLKDRVSLFESEKSDASGVQSSLEDRKKTAEKRQSELKIELAQINHSIERLTLLKNESQAKRDEMTETYAELRSKAAVLQEQVSNLKQQIIQFEQEQSEIETRLERITQEMDWFKNGEGANGPTEEEISSAILKWQSEKDRLTNKIADSKNERTKEQDRLESTEMKLKELQQIHKIHADALRASEIKLNRLEVERSTLEAKLEETYELSIEEAAEYPLSLPDDVARRTVKLLKQSIEELGPVNVASIDEYERVFERHAFLTEQREDLLEAKETLYQTISEMDEEMTTRFGETFYAVKREFQSVFRQLFGGGHADLVLTDPELLLETGVEIIASPPGKKLQNMSLLSGGERALTAIALLFAILNIRPVPFVILDEVEAALDEANVLRYSNYLKKFSTETQFIVITHRKGTMEGADVLYGITMQESGISKLVSVKLTEEAEVLVT